MVHNHPSGDPTPSRADIDMTHAIIAVAKPLGIWLDAAVLERDHHGARSGLAGRVAFVAEGSGAFLRQVHQPRQPHAHRVARP